MAMLSSFLLGHIWGRARVRKFVSKAHSYDLFLPFWIPISFRASGFQFSTNFIIVYSNLIVWCESSFSFVCYIPILHIYSDFQTIPKTLIGSPLVRITYLFSSSRGNSSVIDMSRLYFCHFPPSVRIFICMC